MFGRRNGLFSAIYERRVWGASDKHGGKGNTGGKLDSVINRFSCTRADEYEMDGFEYGTVCPPFAAGFCKVPGQEHVLCVCDEDGFIRLYCTKHNSDHGRLAQWTGHGNAIFDLEWSPHQGIMVTASGDQTARIWDMESTNLMGVFKGHTCSVKSASFRTNDKWVFCTGARDGNILVWDGRCNHSDGYYRPVNSIRNAHTLPRQSTPRPKKKRKVDAATSNPQQDSQQSVTCVVYQDENTVVSAGSVDGTIKLWDMRKNYTAYQCTPIPKHSFQYPGTSVRRRGFSSLVVDSTGTRLFASCTDSTIYMYNCHSMGTQPVSTFTGHSCSSFYVRCALSPCEEYLISGSSDNSAYIWKVNNPEACPWKLTGHSGEVTAVSWCQEDFTKLITCSDDNTMRVWRHEPPTDREGDPNDVLGKVQRVVRTPQKSAGTWKPEPMMSGVGTVGVGSPRMAITVSNKVPTVSAASPKHAAGASPNTEAVAAAGLPTPANEQFKTSGNSDSAKVSRPQLAITHWLMPVKCSKQTDAKENRTKQIKVEEDARLPEGVIDKEQRQALSPVKNTLLGNKTRKDSKGSNGVMEFMTKGNAEKSSDSPSTCQRKLLTEFISKEKECTFKNSNQTTELSEKQDDLNFDSPTANLPNYVVDGFSTRIPSLARTDSDKENGQQGQRHNWLLQLSMQKRKDGVKEEKRGSYKKRKISEKSATSSPPKDKVSDPSAATSEPSSIRSFFSPQRSDMSKEKHK
ncbi:denticleless protein homolog isoform X1 [Branchiostoma lanceolatum]|uniref:denticleless protein homolog isoform X1 n=1 Tax=Branchiostoma lanceolatum TaxID=7740 RepID=UPI003456EC98